jgi:hypothetical protein
MPFDRRAFGARRGLGARHHEHSRIEVDPDYPARGADPSRGSDRDHPGAAGNIDDAVTQTGSASVG